MAVEPEQVPGIIWKSEEIGQYVRHMPFLLGFQQRESDEEEMEGTYSCVYPWGFGVKTNYNGQAARWALVSPIVRENAWRWIEVTVMSPFLFEKQTWNPDMFMIAQKVGLFGKIGGKTDNAYSTYSSFLTENRNGLQDDAFNSAGVVNIILSVMAPVVQIEQNETFDVSTICYLVKLAELEQEFFKKNMELFTNQKLFVDYETLLYKELPDDMGSWKKICEQLCVSYKQNTGLEYERNNQSLVQVILIHSVIAQATLKMISDITQDNLDIVRVMRERLKDTKKLTKLKSYGNESYNHRKFDSAIFLYNNAIKRYPYHAILYSNRCKTAITLESTKLARTDGLRVVVLNPKWSKSYHRYAESLLLNKRYGEARSVCRKGLSYCKDNKDRESLEILVIKSKEQSLGITLNAQDKEKARVAFRDGWRQTNDDERNPENRITFPFTIGLNNLSEDKLNEFTKENPYEPTKTKLKKVEGNVPKSVCEDDYFTWSKKFLAGLTFMTEKEEREFVKKRAKKDKVPNSIQLMRLMAEAGNNLQPRNDASKSLSASGGGATKKKSQKGTQTSSSVPANDRSKGIQDTTKSKASTSKKDDIEEGNDCDGDGGDETDKNLDVAEIPETEDGDPVDSVQVEFGNYQSAAAKAMQSKRYTDAVKNYSSAIALCNEEALKLSMVDKYLLQYSVSVAMVDSYPPNPKLVKEAATSLEQITSESTNAFCRHPMFYHLLARAYYTLNEFNDALKPLEEGIKKCSKRYDGGLKWPGCDMRIRESDSKECRQMLEELQISIKHYPQPLAVCRYEECATDFSRAPMYATDLGFEGYVRIECDWGCKISFHHKCWNKKKANCLQHLGLNGDKDVLELDCITDSCQGKVVHVVKFNSDAVAQFQVQASRVDNKSRNSSVSKGSKRKGRTSKCERNMETRRKAILEAKERKRQHKKKDDSLVLDEASKEGEPKVELVPDDRDVTAAQIYSKQHVVEQAQATPSKTNREKKHQQRMDLSTFMNTEERNNGGPRSGAGSRQGSYNGEEPQDGGVERSEVDNHRRPFEALATPPSEKVYQSEMEENLNDQDAVCLIEITKAISSLLEEKGPISRFDQSLEQLFLGLREQTKAFVGRQFGDLITLMQQFQDMYAVDDSFIGLKRHQDQIKVLTEMKTSNSKQLNIDPDFDCSTDDESSAEEDVTTPPLPTFQAPSAPRPSYPMPSFETASIDQPRTTPTSTPSESEIVDQMEKLTTQQADLPSNQQQQSVCRRMSDSAATQALTPELDRQAAAAVAAAEEVKELLQKIRELESALATTNAEKESGLVREMGLSKQLKEKEDIFLALLNTSKRVEEERRNFQTVAEQAETEKEQLNKQFENQKTAFETQLRSLQEAHDASQAENRQLQQDCLQMKNITETLGSTNRVMVEEKVHLHQLCKDAHVKLLELAKSLRNNEIAAKVEIGRQLAAIISQFYMKYDQQFVVVCVRDLSQSVDNLSAIQDNAKQWFDKHVQEVANDRFNEKFLEDKALMHRPVVHDFFKPFVSFQKRMLQTIENYANGGQGNVATIDVSTQSNLVNPTPPGEKTVQQKTGRPVATSSNLHKVMKELQARFPDATSKELALSVWQVRQQMSHETINVDAIINRVSINIYRSKTSTANNGSNVNNKNIQRPSDYSRQAIGKLQAHEECFLCQDSLMLSAHLTINCGHNFHVSCIDTWTQRHRKCPACYLPVVR